MQIPYSQEYVDLHQIANLGKIIQKSVDLGLLQLPQKDANDITTVSIHHKEKAKAQRRIKTG
jgi:hypothetical protein